MIAQIDHLQSLFFLSTAKKYTDNKTSHNHFGSSEFLSMICHKYELVKKEIYFHLKMIESSSVYHLLVLGIGPKIQNQLSEKVSIRLSIWNRFFVYIN